MIQTRSEENGIRDFTSLAEAFSAAKKDPSIWKISFSMNTERIRLVKHKDMWIYEPIENKKVNINFY